MTSKKQMGIISLSVLFVLCLGLILNTGPCLVLSAKDKVADVLPVTGGDYFDVTFTHSVNKGQVIERYRIDEAGKSFTLETAWFESYGAGMADVPEEGVLFSQEEDYIRLDYPPKPMTEVRYAAAGIAKHKLIYRNKEIDLFEEIPYQSITISIEKRLHFRY